MFIAPLFSLIWPDAALCSRGTPWRRRIYCFICYGNWSARFSSHEPLTCLVLTLNSHRNMSPWSSGIAIALLFSILSRPAPQWGAAGPLRGGTQRRLWNSYFDIYRSVKYRHRADGWTTFSRSWTQCVFTLSVTPRLCSAPRRQMFCVPGQLLSLAPGEIVS